MVFYVYDYGKNGTDAGLIALDVHGDECTRELMAVVNKHTAFTKINPDDLGTAFEGKNQLYELDDVSREYYGTKGEFMCDTYSFNRLTDMVNYFNEITMAEYDDYTFEQKCAIEEKIENSVYNNVFRTI